MNVIEQYIVDNPYDEWKEKNISELMKNYIKLECDEDFEEYCKSIYVNDVR